MANVKPRKRGRGAVQIAPDRVEEHAVPPPAPSSGVELPLEAVRRYRQRYDLPIAPPATFPGFLLGGSVGKLSSAHAKYRRSSYHAAHEAVRDHLHEGIVKEGDAIAEFLYAVQHKDQVFKLRFGRDDGPHALTAAAYSAIHASDSDAMGASPAPLDAAPPPVQPPQPAQPKSHIPLPVEPLPSRQNRTAEYTAVTVHG